MIKVKNSMLNNNNLFAVFQKLMKSPMSVKAAYRVKRYADAIDIQNKEYIKFTQMVVNKYGELDEEGKPVFEFSGEGENKKAVGYKLKDAENFEKEMSAFNEEEFKIEVLPLMVSDLEGVGIAPTDLYVLEPFIADLS